jgi:AraC-like DNA-binding protein
MGDLRTRTDWNPDALRHSTSELWAIVAVAADRGIDVERCLVGTLLDLDTLCHRRARVSFAQQVEIQRRVDLLLGDRVWPVHAGVRLHLTSFGIVGYAMLASENLGSALSLADELGPLLNLKHSVRVERRDGTAALQLLPGYAFADDVFAACEVLEVFKLTNLLFDILGDRFRPQEIRLARGVGEVAAEALRTRFRCTVHTGAIQSEIRFPESLLDGRLPQSDPTTCGSCVELCRHQLEELSDLDRTAGRVRALLEGCIDEPPSMMEVAAKLCMSPRSLRRRLDAEGTSFHEISDGLRRHIAERLLSDTTMTTETIAERLGYGDAANFRHAFKRWTGSSPRQFREARRGVRRTAPGRGVDQMCAPPSSLLDGYKAGGAHALRPHRSEGEGQSNELSCSVDGIWLTGRPCSSRPGGSAA